MRVDILWVLQPCHEGRHRCGQGGYAGMLVLRRVGCLSQKQGPLAQAAVFTTFLRQPSDLLLHTTPHSQESLVDERYATMSTALTAVNAKLSAVYRFLTGVSCLDEKLAHCLKGRQASTSSGVLPVPAMACLVTVHCTVCTVCTVCTACTADNQGDAYCSYTLERRLLFTQGVTLHIR